MIDKERFHIFNSLKKEEYIGSMDGMRYMLRKLEEGDTDFLEVVIWPQPICYSKTPEVRRQRIRFPFAESGVDQAVDWLNQQFDEQKELWMMVRSVTDHQK